jgi:ATP-dependent Clp protease ATP-binding subunit ClpX
LKCVAAKALERRTGARGLRNVLETVMLDIMYSLPSRPEVRDCLINRAVIESGREPVYLLANEERAAS